MVRGNWLCLIFPVDQDKNMEKLKCKCGGFFKDVSIKEKVFQSQCDTCLSIIHKGEDGYLYEKINESKKHLRPKEKKKRDMAFYVFLLLTLPLLAVQIITLMEPGLNKLSSKITIYLGLIFCTLMYEAYKLEE